MNFLGDHKHITLPQFCEASGLSHEKASDVVIKLALNHVIRIVPRELEDWYVFAEEQPE